jgi:hypothetical protein
MDVLAEGIRAHPSPGASRRTVNMVFAGRLLGFIIADVLRHHEALAQR